MEGLSSTFIPRKPLLLGEEKRSDGNDDSLGCKNGAAPAGGGDKPGASYEGDDERASASPRLALPYF